MSSAFAHNPSSGIAIAGFPIIRKKKVGGPHAGKPSPAPLWPADSETRVVIAPAENGRFPRHHFICPDALRLTRVRGSDQALLVYHGTGYTCDGISGCSMFGNPEHRTAGTGMGAPGSNPAVRFRCPYTPAPVPVVGAAPTWAKVRDRPWNLVPGDVAAPNPRGWPAVGTSLGSPG